MTAKETSIAVSAVEHQMYIWDDMLEEFQDLPTDQVSKDFVIRIIEQYKKKALSGIGNIFS